VNGGERLPQGNRAPRFPGFDVLAQKDHWDDATRSTVLSRVHALPPIRFFTAMEEAIATPLLDRLMGQDDDEDPHRIRLVRMVDARLAEQETDGWHYDTMPQDDQAWRDTLAGIDADARERYGRGFAECSIGEQRELLAAVHGWAGERWHGMPPQQVWSLWTRYAATAFYSHPEAWNEIGFPGPAYPRGYKNPGVDKLEPFEVRDARPQDDPVAERRG
jgi:Gluconate 2-dehydrogenase subunit 3